MRVIGIHILKAFIEKHRNAESAIKSWLYEARVRILLIMNTDSGDREHSPWPRIGFSVFLTQ
ncbi:MAG: hypothetical protein KZQ89_18990, partial [Candidatus Thiodiazotropha sp. (ex Lucinoma kastoroae)]|nr:hypothetical protein [Candidatus Thiodiazotropha sp. (ex Lucinoma kastoroae)]